MCRLDGKVALITGGARGIGGETARLMSLAGAKVVVGDILEGVGHETVEAIRKAGGAAEFVRLDVTKEQDWITAIDTATRRFGKLDALVNNAGLFIGRGIEESNLEDWNRLVTVNMTSVYLGTKSALPALRAAAQSSEHGSAIVNVASIAGIVGSPADPLYSATKGGITLFTKSAALEFGRKGYRIRVNSMHPGVIQTEMGELSLLSRAQRAGSNDTGPTKAAVAQATPLGRLGVPSEIAKGIVFLASDDSSYMTGASLVVDGGFTAA